MSLAKAILPVLVWCVRCQYGSNSPILLVQLLRRDYCASRIATSRGADTELTAAALAAVHSVPCNAIDARIAAQNAGTGIAANI